MEEMRISEHNLKRIKPINASADITELQERLIDKNAIILSPIGYHRRVNKDAKIPRIR